MESVAEKPPIAAVTHVAKTPRVLLDFALVEIARALATFHGLQLHAHAWDFDSLPAPHMDRYMLVALKAKDLLDQDLIEQDRDAAIQECLGWLECDGPGRLPGMSDEEKLGKVLELFIARQQKPRAL